MKNEDEKPDIQKEAIKQEGKEAISGLWRKFPQEDDPEKFQETHSVSEYSGSLEEDFPQFEETEDSEAQWWYTQICECEEDEDYKQVCYFAEKAFQSFPEETEFLYFLADAQLMTGKNGKAVKTCEKMVDLEPENRWFWSLYARALMIRGFTKKAYPVCERAYQLGARDSEFLLTYIEVCEEAGDTKKAAGIAKEAYSESNIRDVEAFERALTFFSRWALIADIAASERKRRMIDAFQEVLRRGRDYIDETPECVLTTCFMLLMTLEDAGDKPSVYDELVSMIKPELCSEESIQLLNDFEAAFLQDRICADERFSDTVKAGAEVFVGRPEGEEDIFSRLDWQLCMIREREEVLPQIAVLREEYPSYYQKFADFAHSLERGTGLQNLKNSLMKQYDPMTDFIEDGRFYMLYPEEKEKIRGRIIYQSEEAVPYVRSGKKIGRNDPCPCGSGKKYKNCCMNKKQA